MDSRLDDSPWRRIHTVIALALGVGWMLDAFEVQIIGSVIPGIQAEFRLDGAQSVWINVIWFAGVAVGALAFGFLADRFGRRRLFVATLLMYSVAAILTATAQDYWSFVFFRFITALGVGGEYSAVSSAISEFMPARSRGRSNGLVMTFWAVGGILASVVSIVVISALDLSWRYTLLFGVVSAGYGLIARRLIPESPRWLASRGRLEEADRVIERISGIPTPTASTDREVPRQTFGGSVRELWAGHRPRLAFGMALDFSEAAGYYGLFTAMSVFVFSSATGQVPIDDAILPVYYLIANVGAMFGGIAVSFALDAFGRRPTVTVSYTLAALSMLGCAWAAATGSATVVLIAFTVAAFVATCAWVSAYPTIAELFPTHLRATGFGLSVGVGRTGAIVGQVILALVAIRFDAGSIFALLAGFWLIGTVAGLIWWRTGHEANGRALESLVPAEPGARHAPVAVHAREAP
ncbi:MAG: MFS transporter [Candidatus Limnocylindria bacterium]